jgi:hypothetical protein
VQLSHNLFAEITGIAAGGLGSSDWQNERRLHRRVPFDQRARIFPLMEGVAENGAAVLVRDISVIGVGFLYSEAVGVGDEFIIRLPTTTDQPIDIQCAARRCEMSGTCGSQFAVGASFELVLNRPLATSIAPESEMLVEGEALVDQPALPTIEQRFDHQCVTSKMIRPVILETRWDRFMARPAIQKINRVLTRVFWPATFVYKLIHRALQAGEESRIRLRLSPSKAAKKAARRKKRGAKVVTPPSVSTDEVNTFSFANAGPAPAGKAHPHLFESAPTPSPVAMVDTELTAQVLGRRSLFAPSESAGTEVATPSATAPSPVVAEPPPVAEPTAPVAKPIATPVMAEVPATPAPVEPATPQSPEAPPCAEKIEANIETHIETHVEESQPAAGASVNSFAEAARNEPSPRQTRPPVTHPRQNRRRTRPAFHR